MKEHYLWWDGKRIHKAGAFTPVMQNCPTIDLTYDALDDKDLRYGYWLQQRNKDPAVFDDYAEEWISMPFDEFPAEFKTQLLLLGIT